ncbi:MAG: coproporphyrinogen dehydrogenase HemZ [Ruminococcaceae bacterium]|jgi:oxygen-independent coproporphyrinogen-3 oxidase|nr:coproporphyrinogen dehydrogenase HemZ [Oscillospiraceae bacterium]
MKLVVLNHPFRYEMEKLSREFFPESGIEVTEEIPDGEAVITEIRGNEIVVSFSSLEKRKNIDGIIEKNDLERIMAQLLFEVLSEKTPYRPEWGILTGIRPSKVMRNKQIELGDERAREYFENELFVSRKKTLLAESVAGRQQGIIDLSERNSFSLYISIPFCPTRCSYCSFISHSFESAKKLIPDYLEKLVEEIRATGKIARELSLKLETVYFGGGTPTTLSENELEMLFKTVSESFDLSCLREYTVEAGRPDTVTEEKLMALKRNGVTRISINPQTFNDSVLEAIGRRHNSEQTEKAFILAREAGFDNINMDLIAGLPTDTVDGFSNTLDRTLSLSPENITVHTLSIKRSSSMQREMSDFSKARAVGKMLENAERKLKNEYYPYYMYRQSKSLGSFENTGWCKKGREGLYNIYMMEETHSVFSCGAGAVTKLKAPESEEIERIFNFKYPFEYIKDFGELLSRKDRIKEFYNSYNY